MPFGVPPSHRWSGWPGAVCWNCGIEDQVEICLADCLELDIDDVPCEKHRNPHCPGPERKD